MKGLNTKLEKFKQNQLNRVEINSIIGGRSKTVHYEPSPLGGPNCIRCTTYDYKDGTTKIKMKVVACP